MKRIITLILGMLLILNSNLILFSSSKTTGIIIKPFENIIIKLDAAIKNTASNLEKVKVAFDVKGEATEYGTEVTVNKKKTNELIITPPSSGWRPNDIYFIVIEKGFEFTKNTKLKSNKVYQISIKPHEYKTVKGTVKFDGEYKATKDVDVIVNVTDFSDITIIHSKKIRISKGKNSTTYELKVPVNRSGYCIGYEISSMDDLDYFYTECFIDIGYISQKGTTSYFKERKNFFLKHNIVQDIDIYKNKTIYDKANSIIKKVIKPTMSEYEKEMALYEYVINNIEYDYELRYGTGERDRKSKIYEALYNNRGVCGGYAVVMKLLLNIVGIECDIVGGALEPHAWNLVRIDGDYYHLDATSRDKKYLNFTDEQASIWYIDNDKPSAWPKCTSYKYNYYFHKYWKDNHLEPNTTVVLKGTISLPDGRKAPAGGVEVIISTKTGASTQDPKDDLVKYIKTRIPEGNNSKDFVITVIPNGMEYLLIAYTPNHEYFTPDKIAAHTNGEHIELQLKYSK